MYYHSHLAKVRLPAGTYLIGKHESNQYTSGIEIQSNIALVMDDAVLQMAPTNTWNYSTVAVPGQKNARISGGAITIEGCSMFDNRRQGISIVGGMRVLIENNEIHHIQGTTPQFGIDIDIDIDLDIESLSYLSRDIAIRENSFHHNRGGDFVNSNWIE